MNNGNGIRFTIIVALFIIPFMVVVSCALKLVTNVNDMVNAETEIRKTKDYQECLLKAESDPYPRHVYEYVLSHCVTLNMDSIRGKGFCGQLATQQAMRAKKSVDAKAAVDCMDFSK